MEQVEQVLFSAGKAGVKTFEAQVDPLPNEENPAQQYGHAIGQRGSTASRGFCIWKASRAESSSS